MGKSWFSAVVRNHSVSAEIDLLKVFHALSGNFVRAGLVFEDFDRDPALVAYFVESLCGGGMIDLAHAGAEQVGVVGVVMGDAGGIVADEIPQRLLLGTHGLDVEMELEARVIDKIKESGGLFSGVEKIGL